MSADHIPVWLERQLEPLDDETPIDVLARGDYRRVGQLIGEFEYGIS